MPFTIVFPPSRSNLQYFVTFRELKTQITRLAEELSFRKFKLKFQKRTKYAYVKCRECPASLRYKWDQQEDAYRLKIFNNQHQHEQDNHTKDDLQQFIKELPDSIELATAREIATQRFPITASVFYHNYRKIKQINQSVFDFTDQFANKKDYNIFIVPHPLPKGQLPTILVAISPQMRENFKAYGQVVSYDLVYDLFQEAGPTHRQFVVGVFCGVNRYYKIVPFGISLTCEESTEAFVKILQTFISCQGSPQTFITNERPNIASALAQLRRANVFQGHHLLDPLEVMNKFGRISNRRDLLSDLQEIINVDNPRIWELKIDELGTKCTEPRELRAFNNFYCKKDKVCFCQLPKDCFVVSDTSSSISKEMYHLIRSRIPLSKPFSSVFKILVELCDELYETSKQDIELYSDELEEIFEDAELRLCRYLLASRPMLELTRQYAASFSLNPPDIKGQVYAFHDQSFTFLCIFTGDQFLDCSCGFTEKTGISCRHMLWICRARGISYMEAVHERWKIDFQITGNKKNSHLLRKKRK